MSNGEQFTNNPQIVSRKPSNGTGSRDRIILHVDMNSFYASCHVAQEPHKYRGIPVAVAGDPERRHGIILTASYEARPFGVRTAMPVGEALSLCPQLVLIKPDFSLYREVSGRMLELFRRYTPLVEPFSIDEAWLDLTGCPVATEGAEPAASSLQKNVAEELALPCSVGISDNKLLAKTASGWKKPGGITSLYSQDVPQRLWPLAVEDLFGVGPRTAQKLRNMGISRVGQLAQTSEELLHRNFGIMGRELKVHAWGRDDSPVVPDDPSRKSVSHSITLPSDLRDPEAIRPVLLALADQVGRRLRRMGQSTSRLTLILKDTSFRSSSRSRSLPEPTCITAELFRTGWDLLTSRPTTTVRLVGLAADALLPTDAPRQVHLFPDDDHGHATAARLAHATDSIRERFGEDALLLGALLDKSPRRILDQRSWSSSFQKTSF